MKKAAGKTQSEKKTKTSRLKQPALVLVVEDIPEHVDLITEVLERECAPVFVQAVDSFAQAFQHMQDHVYDLVICGGTVQEEKLSALVKDLLLAARGSPFLVITGSGDEALAARLMKKGITDYVVKNRETLDLLPKFFSKYLTGERRSQQEANQHQSASSSSDVKTACVTWKTSLLQLQSSIEQVKDKKLQQQIAEHLKPGFALAELIERLT